MDIYTILSSVPHNQHHLSRYIKIVNHFKFKNTNSKNMIKHHICPKANDMFPQFKNLNKNKWNEVKVTAREHFILHVLLAKTFNIKSQLYAYNMLSNFGKNKSKLFSSLNHQVTIMLSSEVKNKKHFGGSKTLGIKKYYDLEENTYVRLMPQEVDASKHIIKPEKIDYIHDYYDPETLKSYKIDIRYDFPCNYVKGRSPLTIKKLKISSLGNKANSGNIRVYDIANQCLAFVNKNEVDETKYTLNIPTHILEEIHRKLLENIDRGGENNSCFNTKRYHDPKSYKEYALNALDPKIKELNLILGRSPKNNYKGKILTYCLKDTNGNLYTVKNKEKRKFCKDNNITESIFREIGIFKGSGRNHMSRLIIQNSIGWELLSKTLTLENL